MLPCPDCGFDLSELPATVELPRDLAQRFWLYCPACRGDVELSKPLEQVGVFVHEGRLCRWNNRGKPELVSLGKLVLRLPQVEVLDLRNVCFPAVPRLIDQQGQARLPELPVRPEFTNLVADVEEPAAEVNGRYKVAIRFKGRDKADRIELPFRTGAAESLRGLRLAMWPDVPYQEWSFYLVGGWLDEAGQLGGGKVEIGAVREGRDLVADAAGPGAIDAAVPHAVRRLNARPEYVSLRIDQGGRNESGGCFRITPATQSLRECREGVLLGVDFGTSNTYIAWRRDDATDVPRPATLRDLDRVIVDGRGRPSGTSHPDTWPPARAGTPGGATLPSVLVTREPAAATPHASWRLGVDIGVMSFDEEIRALSYREEDHLVTDLKWGPRTAAGPLPDGSARRRFLELALLNALAALAADPALHAKSAVIRWSYPAVFEREAERDRLDEQAADFAAVSAALSAWTGMNVSEERGVDEARAASIGGTGQDADELMCVDMGGGTVDILFHKWVPFGNVREVPVYALTSFRFAGHDYVNMLVEGKFLNSDITRERLLREVRVQKRLGARFAAWAFDPRRRQAALKRSVMFYRYVMELLARQIAARMLDAKGAGSDKTYTVSVQLFGNGWGFLNLVDPDHHYYIRTWLKDRVGRLCESERAVAPPECAYLAGKELVVECEPRQDTHPKEVVAHGLLKAGAAERKLAATSADSSHGVLGLSTNVQGQRYPWWLPLYERWEWVEPHAPGFPRLRPGQRALWKSDEDPGFDEDLPTLHDIDEGLKSSYAHLYSRVMPDHREWFKRSALEVALEDVIRPALPSIAKVTMP